LESRALLATSPSSTAVFSVVNDWGSGFTGSLAITNGGTSAINGWTLQFDFAPNITQIWNAQIVSHTGTHYVIKDAGYNATIGAGQTTTFGFNGAPGHVTSGPTNYVLNGVALSGGSAPQSPPTVATPAAAAANPVVGKTVALSALGAD